MEAKDKAKELLKTYTHCKQEGCTSFRVLGLDGYCWAHADENLKLEWKIVPMTLLC